MKKTVVSPRITEQAVDFLQQYFPNRTAGAEYTVESIIYILPQEILHLKEIFTSAELKLMVDACNGLLLTPRLAGHHLQASVEDGIRLDNLDMKWEIDAQALLDKIEALSPAQRAILEIWAIGYWHHEPLPDLNEYCS